LTSTIESRERVGASRRAWAIACADSSAGMMPSIRDKYTKLSSADSSSAVT